MKYAEYVKIHVFFLKLYVSLVSYNRNNYEKLAVFHLTAVMFLHYQINTR